MELQAEAWRQREDWASGWLESAGGGRSTLVVTWCFTLVWNAMSWFALIETLRGNATGTTEIAPIFPAIGLVILGAAVYVTIQYRKWGGSKLELLTLPGVLGGPLRCVLHASPALAEAEALKVSIFCTGAEPGEAKLKMIKRLWHHEECVPRERFELDGDARVPLAFSLPYGLPESQPGRTGSDAVWLLSVQAKVPGVDYNALFDLPVFETPESSSEEAGSRVEAPPRAPTPGSGAAPAFPDSKIRVRPWGVGGREFIFGLLRNPWQGLFAVFASLFFSFFVALILYSDGPGFFLVVFSATTLLLAYISVDTLFGITRVRAEPGRIQVRHGPFGIGLTRTFQVHEIERILVIPGLQSGTRSYFRIRIERKTWRPGKPSRGKRVTAGTRIPTQAEAEALAGAMRATLGL